MARRENVAGTIYLLHFDTPYKHAKHYLGWTEGPVEERIASHAAGTGARLLKVIRDAGIGFKLARTWENVTRHRERQIKKGGHTPRYCPICTPRKRRVDKKK